MVQEKSLAKAIQASQYEVSDDDANNWRITHTYGQLGSQWYKISFDHKFCNGLDTMKLFKESADKLLSDQHSDKMILIENVCWAEKVEALDGVWYQGSPHVKAQTIIKDFNEQFNDAFYIPIDMRHAFGEPTLLNYTFNPKWTFQENWDMVRRIKKNEDNFLAVDEEWKKYIVPQKGWVTCMQFDLDAAFTFAHYDYDRVSLQGLGVCITNQGSYWSFDFYAKPDLKQFFIETYQLTPLII